MGASPKITDVELYKMGNIHS